MKINKAILIPVAILGSFVLCFISAYFAYKFLKMSADFLSAGATLSAGLIAIILFNDWRDQHVVVLLEDMRGRIYSAFLQVEFDIDKLELFLIEASISGETSGYTDCANAFHVSVEKLLIELDFYIKIVKKFGLNNKKLDINPEHIQSYMLQILNDLKKYNLLIDKKLFFNSMLEALVKNTCIIEIKMFKTEVNDDLQRLILELVLKKK